MTPGALGLVEVKLEHAREERTSVGQPISSLFPRFAMFGARSYGCTHQKEEVC